jgi:hypothetical protein
VGFLFQLYSPVLLFDIQHLFNILLLMIFIAMVGLTSNNNRELLQKPYELHAAFGIAQSHVQKSNLTLLRNQVNGRVVGSKDKHWWVKKSHLCLNCCAQDAKSVGSLSGAGVMAGVTALPGCASTRYPFG